MTGSWSLGAAAIVLGAVAAFACSRAGGGAPAEAAWLLDGMLLAPPLRPGGPLLLSGRFEVTRAEYAGRPVPMEEADLPVSWVSRDEAAAWASARGLRLPTLAEWRQLAEAAGAGREGSRYPWGPTFQPGLANTLELGLHRPVKVGVFERGRTALGAYDVAGNLWEWVADAPPAPEEAWRPPATAAACGGSFASSAESATSRSVRPLEPGDRAEDIGFRWVAEAEPYILERIVPVWTDGGASDRDWILRSFRRWRPDLRRELAARLERGGAPASLCSALRGA